MPFYCLYDLLIVIIKLESYKIRKIPYVFLLFLNLKNIISSYILLKKLLLCPGGLDPCPRNFLVARLTAVLANGTC